MKRHIGAKIIRSISERTFAFVLIAGVIAALSFEAMATIVQTTTRTINHGETDFGSGSHSFGGPSGPATITYDWSTSTGVFRATGRVRGTLYWDALFGGGCARLIIRFRDSTGSPVNTRRITECGPGGDANNPQNQTQVDESFTSSGNFADISLTVATLENDFEVDLAGTVITHVVEKRFPFIVENGLADFGNGYHSRGAPTESAFVTFRRNTNGTVTGGVDGVLYKDTLFETPIGCATIEITYRNSAAEIIDSTIEDPGNCGPGGNANDEDNQLFVSDVSTSGSLAQIRVLVDSTRPGDSPELWKFNFAGQF